MRLATLAIVVYFAPPAAARVPVIDEVTPAGARRGTAVTLTLRGSDLAGAAELLIYGDGVTADEPRVVDEETVTVRVRSTAAAALGPRPIRLRTSTGLTRLHTFSLTRFPIVAEADGDEPQRVPMNVTVAGVIEDGDADTFRVRAERGQRLAVEVEGVRLGRSAFDGHVEILDSSGRRLAAADDSALFAQDPYLTLVTPAGGEYLIRVREANFEGGDDRYLLHVGDFARPAAAYPPGGRAGEPLTVTFLGDAAGPLARRLTPRGTGTVRIEADGVRPPTPNQFRVVPFPNAAAGQAATPPVAFNGRIEAAGDVDRYRFRSAAGRTLDIRLWGRGLGSPVDSMIRLYGAGGRMLARNDDDAGHDSRLRFTPPADGEYTLEVSDRRNQGGPTHVYRVEVTERRPSLSLFVPRGSRDAQAGHAVAVPRGNRVAGLIAVSRDGFDDDVTLTAAGLPAGVTFAGGPIAAGRYYAPVLFTAADDAKPAGRLVRLTGTSGDTRGGLRQDVDLLHGRADVLSHKVTVGRLAVAVVESVPFRVTLKPTALPRGGSAELRVRVGRDAGFDVPVTVRLPFLPPWVEGPRSLEVGGDTAVIELKATPAAAARRWPILATAEATVGGSEVCVASDFVELTVVEGEAGRPARPKSDRPRRAPSRLELLRKKKNG